MEFPETQFPVWTILGNSGGMKRDLLYCGLWSSCIMTKGEENDGYGQDPPRPGARRHLDHQEAATCRCSPGPDDPAHCAWSHDWTASYDPCRPLGTQWPSLVDRHPRRSQLQLGAQ